MTPYGDRTGQPLARLQAHWEDRALYHPDEEERLISEDEAWRLSRWRDAMNRFHKKHVRMPRQADSASVGAAHP